MGIRRLIILTMILSCAAFLFGCAEGQMDVQTIQADPVTEAPQSEKVVEFSSTEARDTEVEKEEAMEDSKYMVMTIDGTEVPVKWEENDSVSELKELAGEGLTISMSMYGGFEQVGPIGQSIARDDKQTKTSAGDIVLYSGNQLVVFYGSNSWSYTRLGKIDLDQDELTKMLGNSDVVINIRMEEQ